MVAYCLFSDMDEIFLTSSSSQAPKEVKVTMEFNVQTPVRSQTLRRSNVRFPTYQKRGLCRKGGPTRLTRYTSLLIIPKITKFPVPSILQPSHPRVSCLFSHFNFIHSFNIHGTP